jgi:hypothetical protein
MVYVLVLLSLDSQYVDLPYSLGPVAQFHQNSKYYSAIPPMPDKLIDSNLPHITVEMPVYKESLKETMFVFSCLMIALVNSY